MRMAPFFLVSFLLLVGPLTFGAGGGNIDLEVGYREFSSDVFGAANDQGAFAVRFDFGGKIFRPVVGLSTSASVARHELAIFQPFDDEASAFEASGGFLLSRFDKRTRPYFGAGLAWIWVKVELFESGLTTSDRDSGPGYYVNAGFVRTVGKETKVNYGVDARYMVGPEIDILGQTGDADYFQIGFVVGFCSPPAN